MVFYHTSESPVERKNIFRIENNEHSRPVVKKRKRVGRAKLRGSVFLILPEQKKVTIVGNKVDKKVKPGGKIVMVRNGKVVAWRGTEAVFDTYARVKIIRGMENIKPRDVTYGYCSGAVQNRNFLS